MYKKPRTKIEISTRCRTGVSTFLRVVCYMQKFPYRNLGKKIVHIFLMFVICLNVSACSGQKIKNAQKKLRAVNLLEVRSGKYKIFSKIGDPDISSKVGQYEGGEVEILYYKTHVTIDKKGRESDSSFTPLYYYNGALIMIGEETKIKNIDHIAAFNAFKEAFPSRKDIYKVIEGE